MSNKNQFKNRLPYSAVKFCADHFGSNGFARGRTEKKTSGPFGAISGRNMYISKKTNRHLKMFLVFKRFGSCFIESR